MVDAHIYMDHAATTPLDSRVLEAMLPYLTERHGNPSSVYTAGRRARQALDDARETVAGLLGAHPSEIVFTSGGSEANNQALKGVAWSARRPGGHIVISSVEHHSVLDTAEFLAEHGFRVTQVPVDRYGQVDPDQVEAAVTSDTLLVSIMHANNEMGTIQPVEALGARLRERGITFHTDAVQTAGILPLDVNHLQCDLLTLSGHKVYGPKGAGALYIRKGTACAPHIHGGGQERTLRAGTENVAAIVGLAKALEWAWSQAAEHTRRLQVMRDRLVDGVCRRLDQVYLNGHPSMRLPGNANFCMAGVEGESLLVNLDMRGVAASSGSACTSGSVEPSHVLLAMGIPKELAAGSIRFTLGRDNTVAEVDRVVDLLAELVGKLRSVGSVYAESGHVKEQA